MSGGGTRYAVDLAAEKKAAAAAATAAAAKAQAAYMSSSRGKSSRDALSNMRAASIAASQAASKAASAKRVEQANRKTAAATTKKAATTSSAKQNEDARTNREKGRDRTPPKQEPRDEDHDEGGNGDDGGGRTPPKQAPRTSPHDTTPVVVPEKPVVEGTRQGLITKIPTGIDGGLWAAQQRLKEAQNKRDTGLPVTDKEIIEAAVSSNTGNTAKQVRDIIDVHNNKGFQIVKTDGTKVAVTSSNSSQRQTDTQGNKTKNDACDAGLAGWKRIGTGCFYTGTGTAKVVTGDDVVNNTGVDNSDIKRDKKVTITVNAGDDGFHTYTADDIAKIRNNSPFKGKGNEYINSADDSIDYEKYVTVNKDLNSAWERIQKNPNGKEARYWIARMGGNADIESFGKAHFGENKTLFKETYKGDTHCVKGTDCYNNLDKREKPKKCTGGKTWDSASGTCKKGGTTLTCKEDETPIDGKCVKVLDCGNQIEWPAGSGNCVDRCTSTEVRNGSGVCVRKKKENTRPDDPSDPHFDPDSDVYGDDWNPWTEEGIYAAPSVAEEMAAMPQLATVEKKAGLSDSEIVEKRMANLLTGDLAEKVKYEAKTALAARGLFNTAIAEAAGLSAVMEHAFQVASLDATHFYGADLEDVRAVNDFSKTTYSTEATTYSQALNRAHEARQNGFQREWNAREQKASRKWQSYETAVTREHETRMKKLGYDVDTRDTKSTCAQNAITNFAQQEQELWIAYGKEEMSKEIYTQATKKLQDQMDALITSCKVYNDAPVTRTKFL